MTKVVSPPQVEADLEMYRATGEDYLLRRATTNAEHFYSAWKQNPPTELIDHASIARILWLMADVTAASAAGGTN